MHPDRWRRVERLYYAAIELGPEERRRFLESACQDDPDLRREVEEILRHDALPGAPIAAAIDGVARLATLEDGTIMRSDAIGRYRIIERVGQGGMGEVYKVEQLEPVQRMLALKLIKAGMDTRAVVARFESERQSLAVMDHPNIARVFDAGSTELGRPYFTMEFVAGVPITRYCDEHRLDTRERLRIFLQVCEGVQHAHQKGIIHRDIKPSNVLVSVVDDRPIPKIIDFGIAKATAHGLTGHTVCTEMGQVIGTPEYMSPEQARTTGADVDTRTDVYSLGVLLYELLVGTLPFDVERAGGIDFDALRRSILEVDPPRPSTRLIGLGKLSDTAAVNRRTDVPTLARQLRGDLDWITVKALEKDRDRRYGSATELAADIRRHLDDRPVLASPPGLVYRTGKFVRRHRLGVAATALVLIALVTGVVGTALGLIRAMRAEIRARSNAATAEQVSRFMTDLFRVSDPEEARGRSIGVREILDRGAQRIEALQGQPEVRARLMATMGSVYTNLGLFDTARPLLEESLKIRREIGPPGGPEIAQGVRALGHLEVDAGNHDRAAELFREVLEIQRAIDGEDSRSVASIQHDLGHALYRSSRYDEAEPLYRGAVAVFERHPLEKDDERAAVTSSLAQLLHAKGDFDGAESLFRKSLEIRRTALGDDHPDVAEAMHNLATVLHDQRKLDEAETLYRQSLADSERVQGADHPDVADTLVNLARLLREKGDLAGAEDLLGRTLAIDMRVHGDAHENVAYDLKELANLQHDRGHFRDAEATYRRSLAMYRRAVAPDSPYIAVTLNGLGKLLVENGRPREAEPLLRESLGIAGASLPEGHWLLLTSRSLLGACLGAGGKYKEGEPLVVQSYEAFKASLGESDPRVRAALDRVIGFYRASGQADLAASWAARRPAAKD